MGKLVRLVAGQSIAATLESVAALVIGIIISLTASWEVCLVMFAMVPALGITQFFQFIAMKSSEGTIREELSKATDVLHETVHAIREVQSYSLQQKFIDDIEKRIDESIVPASRKGAYIKGAVMGLIQLIQFYVYAFAFWFGGKMITQGRVDFGDFNKAVFAMVFAASGLGQAAVFSGDAAKIFDQINLQIPKGKVVALVGSSGSGKSTVVQLLMRFYDPVSYEEMTDDKEAKIDIVVDNGEITTKDGIVKIDDEDSRKSDCRWLRGNMGYVGQEPVLFDDTIYN